MGRSNFGHIENDRVTPTAEDLQIIADILETSTDYLLGRHNTVNGNTIPSWATRKDVRDFKKMLEEDAPVMFDGVPLDEEDREKVMRVMEAIFWDAKKQNKRKPTDE
jgi:transcriptional regulator with XRE-family HTH domain